MPAEQPLWAVLNLKSGSLPALVDTRAQFSCIRTEVAEYLRRVWEPCVFEPCLVVCILANGTRFDVTNSVRLKVKQSDFTWKHEFKLLNGGPFPIILGLEFLQRTSMIVDMASRTFSFGFARSAQAGLVIPVRESNGSDSFIIWWHRFAGVRKVKGAVLRILT